MPANEEHKFVICPLHCIKASTASVCLAIYFNFMLTKHSPYLLCSATIKQRINCKFFTAPYLSEQQSKSAFIIQEENVISDILIFAFHSCFILILVHRSEELSERFSLCHDKNNNRV
ncbi:hypothetical protein Tsp_14343, partial [Trichinella spiralis]|uniref:hypothetical protein n=1 Tax=Trichinella spiralis TaxID=6334 RepID=UPI0001EFE9FD